MEGRVIGLVAAGVGTAFWNTLLRKDRRKGGSDGKTRKKM